MATSIQIPRKLPLLLVSENVLLPGSSMRIPVRSMKNMNMVKSRLLGRSTLSSTVIGVVPKEAGEDVEDFSSLHLIGTAAIVVQVTGTNWPKPAYTLLATGLCRFKIDELLQETPHPVARVTQLDKLPGEEIEDIKENGDLLNLAERFRVEAAKLVEMLDISIPVVAKLKKMLESVPSQNLPDITTSIVKASYNEKIQVLDAVDLTERFKKTLPLLMRQIEGLKLLFNSKKQNGRVVSTKSRVGRPANMKKTFRKLSDDADDLDSDEQDDIIDLEQKIKLADMPKDVEKTAVKELKRLKKMPAQMPEHAMIRNYLELMVELPWSKVSKDTIDIEQARKDLDADHYGLEKPKKRIVEYLAVRQLRNSMKGPIICFVGPPGVGKTSIGKSIAHTLGREFHRISLGGVCDQSDIRGHRRTYIGSMPGRIIQGLKTVGVKNPVFLLDEIDKLNTSFHGDPAAAMLEVLDPEQNNTFVDHYLNVPFDLSQVLFIATANTLSSIPAALLDRMEVIHVPGYTQEEKTTIGFRHLLPKQFKEHGLNPSQLQIPEDSMKMIVSKYTREAGVRMLERRIGAVCRAVAVKVAETHGKDKLTQHEKDLGAAEKGAENKGDKHTEEVLTTQSMEPVGIDTEALVNLPPAMPIVLDEGAVEDILGPPMYESETSERLSQPGVAIGLAWTMMGGEIMFVEATRMEGEGKLTLTGQLGDVMKESASLALNWVRSHSLQLGLSGDLMENTDLHVHFPAGAVGKDGPSAGVTITTVLVSMFTGKCVRSDTAMTGEITLRGLVLPVGGIKEKILAAHRAGIKRILLPLRNKKDLHEVPKNVKDDLMFVFTRRLEDVLNAAFDDGFPQLFPALPGSKL